jgi:hypothetical protein
MFFELSPWMIEEIDDHRLAFAGAARLQDDLVRALGSGRPPSRSSLIFALMRRVQLGRDC